MQNRDVHVLAIKKVVAKESIENEIFPENVRVFAKSNYKQKKYLLLINTNGVVCVNYPKSQRALHTRPRMICMIMMPQLYQHELLFKAHDAMGPQGIASENRRTSRMTRHSQNIGQYVNQCLTSNRCVTNLGMSDSI